MTFVIAEPFLCYCGSGGLRGGERIPKLFCRKEGIQAITGTTPPGRSPTRTSTPPGSPLPATVPWTTPIQVGVPKTGFPGRSPGAGCSGEHRHLDRGEKGSPHEDFGKIPAVCVMDAGNNGVVILAKHMLPPRKAGCSFRVLKRMPPSSRSKSTSSGRPGTATCGSHKELGGRVLQGARPPTRQFVARHQGITGSVACMPRMKAAASALGHGQDAPQPTHSWPVPAP